MKTRNSSIELLRTFAILGVVVLHYNGNVALNLVTDGSIQQSVLLAFESLFLCAVNTFILISGYFLSNSTQRHWVKVVQLLCQVMVLGVVRYGFSVLLAGGGFSLSSLVSSIIPNNWFVTLYLTLYIVSPDLNLLRERLNKKQMGILLIIALFLFSVWPTVLDAIHHIMGQFFNGMYPLSMGGNMGGYTIVQFGLMYLIGAYLRRFGDHIRIRSHWVALIFFGGVGTLTLWQMVEPTSARSYSNPLIILMAVCAFLLFSRIQIQSKVINRIAQGAFACYILHDVFLPYVGIEQVIGGNPLLLMGHIMVCALGIYLISFGVDFLYGLVSRPILAWVGKRLARWDRYISPSKE